VTSNKINVVPGGRVKLWSANVSTLKNRDTKLLLIQALKGTVIFNNGAIGTPGTLTKNPNFTGRRLSMR
jgi:hypothetical protein